MVESNICNIYCIRILESLGVFQTEVEDAEIYAKYLFQILSTLNPRRYLIYL